jgi:hypothetical protein
MLKNHVGGFENSHIDQTPNHLFMRDAHRIMGDYVLTSDDISQGKAFNDSVAISNAIPDIFGPDQQHRMLVEVPPFDIPYRCLLSKEIDNLMAAGSTMSSDLTTYAAVRYCTPGVCTGQAAGTAAALAAKNNVTPKKLDVKLLQNTLRKQGMHITVNDLSKSVLERYQKRIEGLKKKQLPIEPS